MYIDWDNAPTHPEFEVVWVAAHNDPHGSGWHTHQPEGSKLCSIPCYEGFGGDAFWSIDGKIDEQHYVVYRNRTQYVKPLTPYELLCEAVMAYKLHPTTGNQHKMFDLVEK